MQKYHNTIPTRSFVWLRTLSLQRLFFQRNYLPAVSDKPTRMEIRRLILLYLALMKGMVAAGESITQHHLTDTSGTSSGNLFDAGIPPLLQLQTTQTTHNDPWSQNGRWFFSALWDQHRHIVDLVADLPQDEAMAAIACNFTYSSGERFTVSVQMIRLLEWETTDSHKMRCRLSEQTSLLSLEGAKVTLIFSDPFTHVELPFRNVEPVLPHTGALAACVGPIFSTRPYISLNEFVTYYARIGIQHFFVYVAGTHLEPAVTPDVSIPHVTWMQYQASPTRFYSGQVPMMQDCHNRLRYAYDYLAYFDLDEYLVLNSTQSLLSYLYEVMPVHQRGQAQVSAVTFSTWDFPAKCTGESEEFSLIDPTGLGELRLPVWQTLRWSVPACQGHGANTKNIVRPRFVEQRSPHDVTAFTSTAHHHRNVPCSSGFAKHFRMTSGGVKCAALITADL